MIFKVCLKDNSIICIKANVYEVSSLGQLDLSVFDSNLDDYFQVASFSRDSWSYIAKVDLFSKDSQNA